MFLEFLSWVMLKINGTPQEEPVYAELPHPSTEEADKLLQSLSNETWAKGRVISFDPASNTISLFDDPLLRTVTAAQCNIPLRYHGVPVIPHNFAHVDPTDLPAPLRLSQSESAKTLKDGLTNGQLRDLRDFI